MPKGDEEGVRKTQEKLVQTTLTSSFTSARSTNQPVTSPYFSKPPSGTDDPASVKVNLYPARRAPFKNQTAPALSSSRSSSLLSQVAAETKTLLPGILLTTPHAPADGKLYKKSDLLQLSINDCPKLTPTPIRVLNADSIDAALDLSSQQLNGNGTAKKVKPVLILNMANAQHSGGGWLHGALAQEEALCYRSSLSFTLKNRFYPIPDDGGIYSPTVVIIRESMASDHDLLDLDRPDDLPVASVVSVAAIRGPAVVRDVDGVEKYKHDKDRDLMKLKMRTVLRIAAMNGHRRLILGALGCGAFGNPSEEVVSCWREVFREAEFQGGWWESVVFAVLDGGKSRDRGNFGTFDRGLTSFEV